MRASVCVLGPLLSRFRHARVALPGGCNIGHRPIDLHLRGLAALGADISISEGCVSAHCSQLIGTTIDLAGPAGPTVTGTCNILIAATLAKGTTVIRNAAREPEVQDLARRIKAAQTAEVADMRTWLREWGAADDAEHQGGRGSSSGCGRHGR